MASEVQICNLALSHVGAFRIQSLDDATKEAQECNTLYDPTRDAVLRDHKWGFATKRLVLALLPDTYSGWTYAYQYPSDCLAAREIYNPLNSSNQGCCNDPNCNNSCQSVSKKIDFEIITNDNKDARIVLTNQEDAELIYTAKVTDPNLFDAQFIQALSRLLASDLAVPLRADSHMESQQFKKYLYILGLAQATDSNEQQKKVDDSNSFVQSRL